LVEYTIRRIPEAQAEAKAVASKLEAGACKLQEEKKLYKQRKRQTAVYNRRLRGLRAPFLASREGLDNALENAGKTLGRKREVYEEQWKYFRDRLKCQNIKVAPFKTKVLAIQRKYSESDHCRAHLDLQW
jgi:hypothetical protein